MITIIIYSFSLYVNLYLSRYVQNSKTAYIFNALSFFLFVNLYEDFLEIV